MNHDPVTIIGVDPGIKGAIAYVTREGRKVVEANAFRIPIVKSCGMNLVNVDGIISRMSFWDYRIMADLAVIEEPIKKGKLTSYATIKTTFANYGRLQVAIEHVCKGWQPVHPWSWKSKVGITSDKDNSRTLAQCTFPSLTVLLKKKGSHDLAEALLLAEYAYWHVWLPMHG